MSNVVLLTRNAIFALSNVTFSDGDLSLIKICVTIVTLLGSRILARQLSHGLGNLKAKCSRLHLGQSSSCGLEILSEKYGSMHLVYFQERDRHAVE